MTGRNKKKRESDTSSESDISAAVTSPKSRRKRRVEEPADPRHLYPEIPRLALSASELTAFPELPAERSGRAVRNEPEAPRKQAKEGLEPAALDQGGRRPGGPMWAVVAVMDRLEEAFGVLARLPMPRGPRQFGNGMPTPRQEHLNLIDQVLLMYMGELDKLHAERNKVRLPPGPDELARMEIAISWPGRYLADTPEVSKVVQIAARFPNGGAVVLGMDPVAFRSMQMEGLRRIAAGLARDGISIDR